MEEIEVPVWVRQGGMLVRRDALPSDSPNSTYNYIKDMGLRPEDYGYYDSSLTLEQRKFLSSVPLEGALRYLESRANFESHYGN